jgi:Superfamily II DNA and RNA helicases
VSFSDLGVEPDMVEALREEGIETPFPIQEQTIPVALSGQDIIGQARTGTGKTLGFGPAASAKARHLARARRKSIDCGADQRTRHSVADDLVVASKNVTPSVAAIYGGKLRVRSNNEPVPSRVHPGAS